MDIFLKGSSGYPNLPPYFFALIGQRKLWDFLRMHDVLRRVVG